MSVAIRRASRLAKTLLLAAAIAPGACATVREARRAQQPDDARPGERTPTAAELGLPTSGDLDLSRAVASAVQVHPVVVRARREAEAADARLGEAEAAALPTVAGHASVEYVDAKATRLPSSLEQHRFTSLGFDVSWLLFDFGRTPALERRAALDALAARIDAREAEVAAAFAVRSAYFTLVKRIQLREVAGEAVRQFQEHLDQVREFVRVGTRIPYDATKAEVDLGNAKLTLVQTEDAVLVGQADLAAAIGLTETTEWTPSPDAPLPEPPATFEESWAIALRARPSLAAAKAREQAASALVDAQIADLYPALSLGLGATAAGTVTPFPWTWRIGPVLTWVPFDGFHNLYTIDEAVAALRSARADRTRLEQEAWLEARTAFVAIEDARRRLDLTALVVTNAEQNLVLAQGRYDAGKGTAIELTDARQSVTLARAEDVQAHADLRIATSQLWKALGAGAPPPEPPTAKTEGNRP